MSGKNNRHLFRPAGWLPAIGWLVLLAWVSHLPGDRLSLPVFSFADKFMHFGAYFIAGVLLQCRGWFSAYLSKRPATRNALPAVGLIPGCLHAVLTEYHQLFVPMREFSYWDMGANITGCVVGIFLTARLLLTKVDNFGNPG